MTSTPSSPALPFPVLPDASQAEAFTFGMEKVPAPSHRSLYELSGCITDANTLLIGRHELRSLLAQAAEKDAEIQRLRAMETALHPSQWTRAMDDAWRQALPDTVAAFSALRAAVVLGMIPKEAKS